MRKSIEKTNFDGFLNKIISVTYTDGAFPTVIGKAVHIQKKSDDTESLQIHPERGGEWWITSHFGNPEFRKIHVLSLDEEIIWRLSLEQ
jgi:hypothetical protein